MPLSRSIPSLFARLALAAAAACALQAHAEPLISEIMAANKTTLADEDGAFTDWIEIHNPDTVPVSLAGWYITDNASDKTKWQFPAAVVPSGGYLLLFASNKDRRDPQKRLHTNFALNADGEYVGLIKPDGVTVAAEFAPGFPAQTDDVSFGVTLFADGSGRIGPMTSATPGTANSFVGVAAALVRFSREAGPFSNPFTLVLSGNTTGEHIRYVAAPASAQGNLVAKEPTLLSPQYTGPIQIQESMVIRAAVFSDDGGQRGPSSTKHYLKVATTGPQRADTFDSTLPVIVAGMHGFGPLDENGTAIPGWVHVFAPDNGAGSPFAAPTVTSSKAVLAVRGNSSSLFPKKSYNIELFDDADDERQLSLLGMPESDDWALSSPWLYDRAYIRNAFVYTLSNKLGRWAPRTRFVEVFFDGDGTLDTSDYAGISLLTERIQRGFDRVDIARLSPDDNAGSQVTGGYILKVDTPNPDDWSFVTSRGIPYLDSAQVVVTSPNADVLTQAQRDYIRGYVQQMEDALFAGRESGWRNRTYLNYLDFSSWVDHHLLQTFSGNVDALSHSAYFHKDRDGKIVAGPVWDFDRALGSYDPRAKNWDSWTAGHANVWDYGWWGVIARDPEFMQAWVDRWQSLRQNELSAAALKALAESLAAEVGADAAARDVARWPDNSSQTGNGFAGEITRLVDWVTRRAAWIDTQFVAPPTVSTNGDSLTFRPAAGAQIVYTLDGSDPRSLNGGIAPNALVTGTSVIVNASVNVHVRSYNAALKDVFPGSPWSSAVGGRNSTPLSPKSRLVNISARGLVGSGENALIAGVVVADAGPGKAYLARAVGPTLAMFGATSFVTDPQLSIFNEQSVEIFRNNGWSTGAGAAELAKLARSVGAFPLTAGSADSALAPAVTTGAYTVQVITPSGRTGIGLAELYETDDTGRTLNLSTRAQVGTGEGVLIGGFVVQGTAHKRMLIRGIGPTLRAFGLETALADPVLTLYSGQNIIGSNDRWSTGEGTNGVAAANTAVGAFVLSPDSEDAALLVTLPPGAYTVEIKGKGDTQGVALLEIYEVP